MRFRGDGLSLSATDLANHLGCQHLTALDTAAVLGRLERPAWQNPVLEVLMQRGLDHERAYLDYLRSEGRTIVELPETGDTDAAFQATCDAMRHGIDIIVQPTLVLGQWHGRADILRRVTSQSALGPWSYEVVDTKLANETRAGTILQLTLYSDIVSDIQQRQPETMVVVSPGDPFRIETYRVNDYAAFVRLVRRKLLQSVSDGASADGKAALPTYPEPVAQCDICRWWSACDKKWREDDHLSLVAGISRTQRKELGRQGITTLTDLGSLSAPLAKPERGSVEALERIREQARVQLEQRRRGEPVYELLPVEEGHGLCRLPQPSPNDIFFDLEGDAFVGSDGLEYLFGYAERDPQGELTYHGQWALTPAEEKHAFEAFVDHVMDRWSEDPTLHIYHYAAYEPSALKRLMGRHATRQEEIDKMLRAKLFVDLWTVTRQAVRAGVERYSIKDMEPFYEFQRAVPLRDASANLRAFERALELGGRHVATVEVQDAVEGYNRDDCISLAYLRDWLEERRQELVDRGEVIARPPVLDGEAAEEVEERCAEVQALMDDLLRDIPDDPADRTADQRACWLVAHMLEWHRREDKVPWWEYFRLRDLPDDELADERAGLAGLRFVGTAEGGTAKCPIHEYDYPAQDFVPDEGAQLHWGGQQVGTLVGVDHSTRRVRIKKTQAAAELHPTSVFQHKRVGKDSIASALFRLGQWIAQHGPDAPGPYRAARDLLMNHAPRIGANDGLLEHGEDEDVVARACRLALSLNEGVLPIQGPPGAGKTFTAARMIAALLRAGKKVGVSAVSHKVVRKLMVDATGAAAEDCSSLTCIHKLTKKGGEEHPCIQETTSNPAVVNALAEGTVQLAGGTAWLWSRPEMAESVDVLFIDEAGQMSLPMALAAAQAGKSLVLLGDPQQLDQPQQGSHPEGTAVSALEHVLGEHKTMPTDRGLFLPRTWRLHPTICEYTSETFYEGRLSSRPGLDSQAILGTEATNGAGLWHIPVEHQGNQNSSVEEVDTVEALFHELVATGARWREADGTEHPLDRDHILIVAPYNAQVDAIAERLPTARVGTVDRFQGQEAPVVIYSMATSTPEDTPRGMEFLYSLNRLNVATSRALCACILVASPRLFEPECRTPRQIQLANAFCRYLEVGRVLT